MCTEIMTPGKKIKNIRKLYKIKQHEITGEKITRNLISIIENDKASLTNNTAEIIAENINKVCKNKGIDFIITTEYLLEGTEDQSRKVAKEFINFINENKSQILKGSHLDKLGEIEKLLSEYNLSNEKFILYNLLGDIYRGCKEHYRAYTYYLKAYENSNKLFNDRELVKLILNIGYCCNKLKRYKDTLDFHKLALIYNDNLPKDLKYVMMFNNIKSYKNLKDYNSALIEINNIEKDFKDVFEKDISEKFDVLTLKGNCFKNLKSYNDAILTHKSILNFLNEKDIEYRLIVFCNLIEIYLELNDTKNIKKYLDKSFCILKSYEQLDSKNFSAEIYKDIALAYFHIGNLRESKKYLYKALKSARENKNIDVIYSAMDKLISITSHDTDNEELDYLKNQLLELMSANLLPQNNVLLLKLINYYNTQNKRESIDNLISFTLNLPINKNL